MPSRKRHALKGLAIGIVIAISPLILGRLLALMGIRSEIFSYTIGLPGVLLYGLITMDPHSITPAWWLLLNAAFWAPLGWGIGLLRADRATHQNDDGHTCAHCGYFLTGNVSGRCPECGQPISRESPGD